MYEKIVNLEEDSPGSTYRLEIWESGVPGSETGFFFYDVTGVIGETEIREILRFKEEQMDFEEPSKQGLGGDLAKKVLELFEGTGQKPLF